MWYILHNYLVWCLFSVIRYLVLTTELPAMMSYFWESFCITTRKRHHNYLICHHISENLSASQPEKHIGIMIKAPRCICAHKTFFRQNITQNNEQAMAMIMCPRSVFTSKHTLQLHDCVWILWTYISYLPWLIPSYHSHLWFCRLFYDAHFSE